MMEQKTDNTNLEKRKAIMIDDCNVNLNYKDNGARLAQLLQNYLANSLNYNGNL
ncbi:MAG: hypothetical protein HFE75_01485 [Firmicutes bacterium]|nr:hypothetical protein [Bacillota bacterium]